MNNYFLMIADKKTAYVKLKKKIFVLKDTMVPVKITDEEIAVMQRKLLKCSITCIKKPTKEFL